MELGKQIRKLRQDAQISQEELAERVFVSRQTISNWENDKSYPDVHSLVLLSEIFHITIDELIKGDVEVMKDVINKESISEFNFYARLYTISLVIMLVSAIPLFFWLGFKAFLPWGCIVAFSMAVAFKVEKLKKANDIQTFKEIVAFSEGRKLDEIQKQREIGKRPYQRVMIVIAVAVFAFIFCSIMAIAMVLLFN